MKHNKTIKQLMAIGVQRNDAAAFARAYRKIMDAKREDLFPEIVKPVMPVFGNIVNYRVEPFRAVYAVPDDHRRLFCGIGQELSEHIKQVLSEAITQGLIQNGAITIEEHRIMGIETQYIATVRVVMPNEWI